MNLSATQLETAEMCGRKWWLRYHAHLPEIKKDTQSFGSVLHGVCERYLKKQELYPVGWSACPDTKKEIDPVDAALIQVLIKKAIEEGILERRPGGKTEEWFQLACDGHMIRGKKDYSLPGRDEDHKNSKSVRYFKSAEALKKSIQMMIYAKENLEREFRAKGLVPPKFFSLVHNQYLRDTENPLVRRREAEVTPSEIDDFWETKVKPLVRKIDELSRVASPFHIPDPDKSACEAYGGCTYATICHSGEDMLTYKQRVDSFANSKQPQPLPQIMTTAADFLAKRMASMNSTAAVNPPTTQAPAAAPVVQQPANAFPANSALDATPPWLDPNCPVCRNKPRNKGFRDDGRPCKICLIKNKGAADGYSFGTTPDGRMTWHKAGEAVGSTQLVQPAAVAPAKTAFGMDQLLPRLQAMGSLEGVATLIGEAEGVLGAGTADYAAFVAAAEKRMTELETPPVKVTDPTPTTVAAIQTTVAPPSVVTPPAAPVQQTLPTMPEQAPPAETKARRGRPKGSKNKPAGAPAAEGEAAEAGFVLLVGAVPLKWEGREVVAAEEILNGIEGYWAADDVWKRRNKVRTDFASPAVLATLEGVVVVQSIKDPDIENLISTLIPHASAVVRGVL